VPDPAAVEGSLEKRMAVFKNTFLVLQRRIQFFLTFRFKELKRAQLQQKLSEAGKLA
jgi:arsenate reductase